MLLFGFFVAERHAGGLYCLVSQFAELVQSDELALCKESGAADDIFHLTQIARPLVFRMGFGCFLVKADKMLVQFAIGLIQKKFAKRRMSSRRSFS